MTEPMSHEAEQKIRTRVMNNTFSRGDLCHCLEEIDRLRAECERLLGVVDRSSGKIYAPRHLSPDTEGIV